jgi:uncharacterized membrane protein YfcA
VTAAWFSELRSRGLAARSGLLGFVTLGIYALVAPAAFWLSGPVGPWAAAAAAGLCLAGAAVALAVSHRLRGPQRALHGLLLGTAGRMGIPLGFGLALHLLSRPLAEAGLLYYLLVFYPVTLGVEIALSLPPRPQPTPGAQLSQDGTPDG